MKSCVFLVLSLCCCQLGSQNIFYPGSNSVFGKGRLGRQFQQIFHEIPNRLNVENDQQQPQPQPQPQPQRRPGRLHTQVPNVECKCGVENGVHERVVGGNEVRPKNRFPWMALITEKGEQLCGGAIINNRFVLTAAHCIDVCEDSIENCKVILGVHNISEGKGVYDIQKVIKHDDYSLFAYDIGLIQLKQRIKFGGSVQPICLPEQQDPNDIKPYTDTIMSAGWGLTANGKGSDVLMQFSAEDWLKNDKSKSRFCKDLLCLKPGNGRFESGDSGGPAWITVDGKSSIVGVVSHYRLHRMRLTRVPLVKNWILTNTKSAHYCR